VETDQSSKVLHLVHCDIFTLLMDLLNTIYEFYKFLQLHIVRILYRKGFGLQPQLGCSPLGFGEAQP
jgi:hypothetical protein